MRDPRAAWRSFLFEDTWLKALSLVLALGAWWWVQGQQTATEPLRIVLDWQLPDDLVPTTTLPTSATAIVQGPRSLIRRARLLRPTIVADLREEGLGTHDVQIAGYGIDRLPAGLTVLTVTPETETVELDRRVRRKMPVQPIWVGTADETHAVRGVSVVPDVVEVAGAREAIAGLRVVNTVPLDVSEWKETRTVRLPLDLPSGVAVTEPWQGEVTVEIASVITEKQIQGVPVVVLGRDDWRPAKGHETLTVTLRGPTEVLLALRVDHVFARVDLPLQISGDQVTATYQAARAPRLEILTPRSDAVEVQGTPGPVLLERR